MARPPRIAVRLPWEADVIYFMTICVDRREKVLANLPLFELLRSAFLKSKKWNVLVAVVMPDHVHAIVSPKNRGTSPTDFSHFIKRKVTAAFRPSWAWQRGCFDHLLRSDESFNAKMLYVLLNPVRAGLVTRWQDWQFLYLSDRVSTEGLESLGL